MLVLYYGNKFPYKFLSSCVCNYHFVDTNRNYPMKIQTLYHVKELVEKRDINLYGLFATNIRVPEMDADKYIQNRFAYTSVFIGWEEAKTLSDVSDILNSNDKLLKWFYKKAMEDKLNSGAEGIVSYLQQQIWISIEPELKAKLICTASSFLQKWSAQASLYYMTPDYIWKSGNNHGKTTMEILTERWNNHISKEK